MFSFWYQIHIFVVSADSQLTWNKSMMLIIADSELTEQEKKVWMRQKKKKTFFLGFVNLPADGKIFKFINSYYCVCATDYWADLKHLRLSLQSVLITEESLKEIWSAFIMYAVEKTWLWTDFFFCPRHQRDASQMISVGRWLDSFSVAGWSKA